jgi:hypothetical protein
MANPSSEQNSPEPRRKATVPVRIPDEVYCDLRRWAQIKGRTPGDIVSEAWNQWVVAHKAEILAGLDEIRADVETRS